MISYYRVGDNVFKLAPSLNQLVVGLSRSLVVLPFFTFNPLLHTRDIPHPIENVLPFLHLTLYSIHTRDPPHPIEKAFLKTV